jgi:hypothetical protein
MISAFSLSFLRPIYKAVRNGSLVLVLVQWSRQAGNRQVYLLDREWVIREFILKAKKWHQALISYQIIDEPKWWGIKDYAIIPDKDGELRTGAY